MAAADEIDIGAKFAGRIAEMLTAEGDMVKAGQVLARMGAQDFAASLHKAEAQVQESQQSLDEARANVEQQKTQVTLAQQEFRRANALIACGFATNELLDRRQQALNAAIAALDAANDRAGIDVVWPQFLLVALIGGLFFSLAVARFRTVAAQAT